MGLVRIRVTSLIGIRELGFMSTQRKFVILCACISPPGFYFHIAEKVFMGRDFKDKTGKPGLV